jgi:hypothetical protein
MEISLIAGRWVQRRDAENAETGAEKLCLRRRRIE